LKEQFVETFDNKSMRWERKRCLYR